MMKRTDGSSHGFLGLLRSEIPEHRCEATGSFKVEILKGVDVLIPTMCRVTDDMLAQNEQVAADPTVRCGP